MLNYLPFLLFALICVILFFVRKHKDHLQNRLGIIVDFVPLLLMLAGLLICNYLFHERSSMRIKYHWSMAVSTISFFLIFPVVFWGKLRAIVAGLLLSFLSTFFIGDLVYIRFFGNISPILSLGSGAQVWDIRDSILAMTETKDWLYLCLALCGIVLAIFWPSLGKNLKKRFHLIACAVGLGICLLGTSLFYSDLNQWMNHRWSWKVFEMKRWIPSVGIFGAHLRDIARVGREMSIRQPITEQEYESIAHFHQARLSPIKTLQLEAPKPSIHDPKPSSTDENAPQFGFGNARDLNVLFIQVEAMQAWAVDHSIGDKPIMPFLQSIKERSLYFRNIWDQTGASPTSDCEYLILNSQHPLARGSVAFRRQDNDFVTLPHLLKEAGYTTFSSHGYRKGMWNRAVLHPRYGFEQSAFEKELGRNPKLGWGLHDKAFFKRLVPRLKELSTPWFGFAITLTTHHPYTYIPKKQHRLKLNGLEKLDKQLAGYIHSMRYMDEALKQLFSDLKKKKLLQKTVVVIYGDHDSKLKFKKPARKAFEKLLNLDSATAFRISTREWRTKKIPLFFVFPEEHPSGSENRGEIMTVGGQIDIGPTLLHYLGIEKSPAFLGQPLLANTHSTKSPKTTKTEETSPKSEHAKPEQAESEHTEPKPSSENPVSPLPSRGFVARYDQSMVTPHYVWLANKNRCYLFSDQNKRVDAKLCQPMIDALSKELEYSKRVTLEDLARRLHQSP